MAQLRVAPSLSPRRIAGLATVAIVLGAPAAAGARPITPRGLGHLHWGLSVRAFEQRGDVTIDCSGGAVPGTCLCPEITPDPGPNVAFSEGRFVALFTSDPSDRTSRGIGVGDSAARVRSKYPSARKVDGGLGGGLATYLSVRRGRHRLAFDLDGSTVRGIYAARTRGYLRSELCA